jgi:hypothetical protein
VFHIFLAPDALKSPGVRTYIEPSGKTYD